MPVVAWSSSSTTPLRPMANGTASPSTPAWAASRIGVGTTW